MNILVLLCFAHALTPFAWAGFGHKAGYLPPPQSIKAQVMAGTLLSASKEPVAPPPFNPLLSAKKGGAITASSALSPPPTAVKSDDDASAAPDSSDASDAAPAKVALALPVSGIRTPSILNVIVLQSSPDGVKKWKNWAKNKLAK